MSTASALPTHSILKANPFGILTDPAGLASTTTTSPQTVISQTVYSISSKVFSYETPLSGDLLDANLGLWEHYQRPNAFGVVPVLHRLQVRSGASNTVLGYYSKKGTHGQPLTILAGAGAVGYMQPQLAGSQHADLPLALHVSAVDYDGAVHSNYGTPLRVARDLGYPVVSPVRGAGRELQDMAVLAQYVAAATGQPCVHLYEGPGFLQTFTRMSGLRSSQEVGALYEELLRTPADSIGAALAQFNRVASTSYAAYEYAGPRAPETVFVAYGAVECSSLVETAGAVSGSAGVVSIRIALPFDVEAFSRAIPTSTKRVVVLASEAHVSLRGDVTAALFAAGRYHDVAVDEYTYPKDFAWTPITTAKVLAEFVGVDLDKLYKPEAAPVTPSVATWAPTGKYSFWGPDAGVLVQNTDRIARALSLDSDKDVSTQTRYDNGTAGGVFHTQVSTQGGLAVDAADVVVVEGSFFEAYDVLATAKPGANVVYVAKGPREELVAKLPTLFRRTLVENHNTLTLVDLGVLGDIEADVGDLGPDFLVQLAFWKVAVPSADNGYYVSKLLQANGNDFELLGAVLEKFVEGAEKAYSRVARSELERGEEKDKESEKVEEKGEESEESEEKGDSETLPFIKHTSLFANPRNPVEAAEETVHSKAQDAAIKLAFPEAYALKKELRPDLPVQNFVVRVQENKRLTPAEYSRNIFHIEFDTTGTGLKYEIGEALGIHGRNPADAVNDFLAFYGVDANSLVHVTNRDDPTLVELRTASQALTENVDFLGKPPKRFYEALATYATDEKQAAQLSRLGGAEGAADLKKRQDVDFDSYFDVLAEFDSARPPFEELVGSIIAPLKRREYSIASSQKLHPNAVHLLVVVVDWVDPRGRTRYGHCSKYLSDLAIGSELVVSVKPSVMKLPPLSTQPIVMSGLGTGLAPFKAFVEEKIWQKQQGLEIGEVFLYLGSRHKKEEYLYGELWEAYKDAGILTHIGAAFSRDQPEKIYIQDKIRESIQELTDAIIKKNGSFYLCGPTWPVPDITACLEDIVRNGGEVKDASKVVEDMKEEGRYVLEVY